MLSACSHLLRQQCISYFTHDQSGEAFKRNLTTTYCSLQVCRQNDSTCKHIQIYSGMTTNQHPEIISLMAVCRMWTRSQKTATSLQQSNQHITLYFQLLNVGRVYKLSNTSPGFGMRVWRTVNIRLIRIYALSLLLMCNSCKWILSTDSHKEDRISGLLSQAVMFSISMEDCYSV